jgi:hypothetical protein
MGAASAAAGGAPSYLMPTQSGAQYYPVAAAYTQPSPASHHAYQPQPYHAAHHPQMMYAPQPMSAPTYAVSPASAQAAAYKPQPSAAPLPHARK